MTRKRDNIERGDPTTVDAFDGDLEALVRKSLDRLLPLMNPELTEVFRRAELLGESCETIAASLEISVETAKSRLEAARAEMWRLLELSARSNLNRP